MKLALRLTLLAAGAALIAWVGYSRMGSAIDLLRRAGTTLLWIAPLHLLPLVLDAKGWQALLPRGVRLGTLLWVAAVREAFNRLLPVGNVGGDIIGVQLLTRNGPDVAIVTASVLVETLLTLISQLVFALLGTACLYQATGNLSALERLSVPLAGATLLIMVLWLALRSGTLFERLGNFGARPFRGRLPGKLRDGCISLDGAINLARASPARWVLAGCWQFCGFLAGSLETWLALRWLGHPVGVGPAIALESITLAARSLLFFVPAGLGVQELSLLSIGQLLGVPAEAALALSLTKRMRELVFGLPVLAGWYAMEGVRALRRTERDKATTHRFTF